MELSRFILARLYIVIPRSLRLTCEIHLFSLDLDDLILIILSWEVEELQLLRTIKRAEMVDSSHLMILNRHHENKNFTNALWCAMTRLAQF